MSSSPSTDLRSPTGYRRSAGSPRGEARKRELLERVTDEIAANGLVDFSLRRAARAAGTTHKVLLYHFDGVEDLLAQAMVEIRQRRIEAAIRAVNAQGGSLAERVRAIWPVLVSRDTWIHDQAIGLMMYDPDRYGELGRGSSQQYLPVLVGLCPDPWTEARKHEVAEMIMATLRGFVVDRLASGEESGIEAGFRALGRALDREERADQEGA
ncbi:MAG TPA: TetR/AcrR family transcriptional regulator [Acidimicrobiales bacterium]|nr:TetR/AcrR family transcriptional regulator [Acidimicrobiales bacterium]